MNDPGTTGWTPCKRGELTHLVSQLAFRKKMLALILAGSVLATASGIGAATWYLVNASSGYSGDDGSTKPTRKKTPFVGKAAME